MTQTPASGPFGPDTTPPISSLSIAIAACCALVGVGTAAVTAAIPIAATVENRSCRKLILSSLKRFTCASSLARNGPVELKKPPMGRRHGRRQLQPRSVSNGDCEQPKRFRTAVKGLRPTAHTSYAQTAAEVERYHYPEIGSCSGSSV